MNLSDASHERQDPRKPLLSYRVTTFVLFPVVVAGLLAAASVGFYFGSVVAGIVCLLIAALNAARLIFLIRIGKKGWDTRVSQGRR